MDDDNVQELPEDLSGLEDNLSGSRLFDEDPEDQPEETPEEVVEQPEETLEPEIQPEDQPEETTDLDPTEVTDPAEESSEEEEDFDAPIQKKETTHKLREMLQEKGREAKTLKTENQELQLEIERLKAEADQLKEQVETSSYSEQDIYNHPDIARVREAIQDNQKRFSARHLRGNTEFASDFPELLNEYANADSAPTTEAMAAQLDGLRAKIFNKFADKSQYDSFDLEEGHVPQDPTVDKIMDFLEQQLPALDNMYKKSQELQNRVKTNSLAKGVEEYAVAEKEVTSILSQVGDLPEEYIEENPHKPEVVIAKLIKENPEAKRRAASAAKYVLEAFHGNRPLTQDEIDKIKANHTGSGDPIKEFEKNRSKKLADRRNSLMQKAFMSLMLFSDFEEMHKGYSKFSTERDEIDSEEAALDNIARKAKDKPQEAPKAEKREAYKGLLDLM